MTKLKRFITWRNFRWTVSGLFFIFAITFILASIYLIRITRDLPSVEALAEYKPPVMTRVHAGDGRLIAEYATQHRVFVPIESIPKDIQNAFVAAEDQRFYEHNGFDLVGFTRAMLANIGHTLKDERLEGASTITQQVTRNMKSLEIGSARKASRKIREIVTARRIEKAMDKDHILELYLNEIYLGERSWGVAAAGLNYFGKSLIELNLSETAYLAALPKAPNNYDLVDDYERAINRRNYVLSRLVEEGYASEEDAKKAKAMDLVGVKRLSGEEYLASDYFVEETRRKVFSMYGEDELYSGGLSIRTTLDTGMQVAARRALRSGLEDYDKRYGYRGPLDHFDSFEDWKAQIDTYKPPKDIGIWRAALVLKADANQAKLGFSLLKDEEARPDNGVLALEDMKWARPVKNGKHGNTPKAVTDVLQAGDIILVEKKAKGENAYRLEQVPEVNGAIMAMDPHTGRILASVGGYSFYQSQFNRATQAKRQPGSAFKPFVYAAALDNGFTPASQVLDAPFVTKRQDTECDVNELGVLELRGVHEDGQIASSEDNLAVKDECERFYKPSNYAAGKFYGLSTLRLGLEKSRNAMTVRLASDIGMSPIMNYAKRFHIYDEPRPELAWALGAGETTLLRMATAYSILINGGKDVSPHIIDRVQDGQGKTILIGSGKYCDVCQVEEWDGSPPPDLPDEREAVIDPVTAYQITYMLQGVVQRGTGVIVRSLGYPLGGKTGTTNDYKDAWFMGFSPDLVAGVYVGYDTPRTLNNEAGSKAAAPIFKAFMAEALKTADKVPFRIPEGVTLVPIDRTTGEPSYIGAPNFILEAFRPGTEPRLGELSSTIRIGGGESFISLADIDDVTNAEDDALNAESDEAAAAADLSVNVPGAEEDTDEGTGEDRDGAEDGAPNNVQASAQEATQDGVPDSAQDGVQASTPDDETANAPDSMPEPATAAEKNETPEKSKDNIEENLDEGLY